MKKKLLNLLRFSLESLGVAGAIYVLLQTVMISRDNQDTLNEMATRIDFLDKDVLKTYVLPRVHVRHTWRIDQWQGSKLK